MIDIESFIFAEIASVLRNKYVDEMGATDIFVSGEYVDVPARFPAVTIIENSNIVLKRMRTLNIENAATLMYEVNVFSNKIGYKKAEAKEILSTVDEVFESLGFTRVMSSPTPNIQDSTIYRMTARYEGNVMVEYDDNGGIFRIYTN